jgi:putative DNA methylase
MQQIKSPKKLIEVALPLDDINVAAAREKSIRHGHPSTLHLWWARRPLAAARAVLFAQLVNDPGYQRELGYGVNKKEAEVKREKLFQIIRDLVKWENTNNEEVLNRAREAIWESWRETCHLNRSHPQAGELFNPEKLPAFHDPFAGGGAIPLEAQRLGLESYASDLNPVAVLINKAMIEIPPRFAGQKPVGPWPEPDERTKKSATKDAFEDWAGAQGLAEDVRRYGLWMQKEALKRIGHLYPKIKITPEIIAERPDLKNYQGEELTVIAWLWSRTVRSPNPAYSHVDVPLASNFVLSTKKGKEVYVEPIVEGDQYRFEVKVGVPPTTSSSGTKASGRGANFHCLLSGSPIDGKYIKSEGQAGRIKQRLMAVVVEGKRERVYLSPSLSDVKIANSACTQWRPNTPIAKHPQYIGVMGYGFETYSEIYTERQLFALKCISDLVKETSEKAVLDCLSAGLSDEKSRAYAASLATYLAFSVDRLAMSGNSLVRWNNVGQKAQHCFGRQALPMLWDFAEVNFLGSSTGSLSAAIKCSYEPLRYLGASGSGFAFQRNAVSQQLSVKKVISTDPPYYDNVPYADLSDFFYSWLRPLLKDYYPDLFSTLAVPKSEELVADYKRHGGRDIAHDFFMSGMREVFTNISRNANPCFPITVYYAFKQGKSSGDMTGSSGWETFLEAVVGAGLTIGGTWPMRTEMPTRQRAMSANALASSVVLVCRKCEVNAETISRRDFQRQLREDMPEALETMIGGETGQTPIAPVDLAQAAIGPGMAIYSKYKAVLNQDGSRMSVHDALVFINRAITEYLSPDSGNFDADTQFCSSWFEQYGWSSGEFGEADTLARAKGTSVDGVKASGVADSGAGKVRLLRWAEYESDWDPTKDDSTPIWEACHQMIRRLNNRGESAAGELLAKMPEKGEAIRQLAYHLYTLCERKKWAEEARAYNELIASWHAIVAASHDVGHKDEQADLDF